MDISRWGPKRIGKPLKNFSCIINALCVRNVPLALTCISDCFADIKDNLERYGEEDTREYITQVKANLDILRARIDNTHDDSD